MNYVSSFCFTFKSTFKSGLCKFLSPKGALTHHFVIAKSAFLRFRHSENYGRCLAPPLPTKQALRGPVKRWYPVRWPGPCALPRAIRCCRQHRLCSHSQQALPACLPTERDWYIRQITVPDMAACENLSPTAFLQRNMRSYIP